MCSSDLVVFIVHGVDKSGQTGMKECGIPDKGNNRLVVDHGHARSGRNVGVGEAVAVVVLAAVVVPVVGVRVGVGKKLHLTKANSYY